MKLYKKWKNNNDSAYLFDKETIETSFWYLLRVQECRNTNDDYNGKIALLYN